MVLQPEPERRGFQLLSLESFGKTLRKVNFCITIMAGKSMKDSKVLKTPVPEQRLTSS